MTTIKAFWDIVKPFVTNTSIATNDNIAIEAEKMEKLKLKSFDKPILIKARCILRNEKVLVEVFNKQYINIVETKSGIIPK